MNHIMTLKFICIFVIPFLILLSTGTRASEKQATLHSQLTGGLTLAPSHLAGQTNPIAAFNSPRFIITGSTLFSPNSYGGSLGSAWEWGAASAALFSTTDFGLEYAGAVAIKLMKPISVGIAAHQLILDRTLGLDAAIGSNEDGFNWAIIARNLTGQVTRTDLSVSYSWPWLSLAADFKKVAPITELDSYLDLTAGLYFWIFSLDFGSQISLFSDSISQLYHFGAKIALGSFALSTQIAPYRNELGRSSLAAHLSWSF